MSANPNYIHLKKRVPKDRVTLLQGGTRSGKTFSIIYYLIWLCKNHPDAGMEIDIVRDTFKALKATAWKDFKEILIKHHLYDPDKHNKTDHIYNLFGNYINYYGADNTGKIHGRSRDILWINEAHLFPEEIIDQLFPRTRFRVIADYNPALPVEHWLDRYIEEYDPCITTYLDNPHLTRAQIADIEGRKNQPYWWQVYGAGKRAKPMGAIFNNYELGDWQDSVKTIIYGQDYGFSNDPTVLVKLGIDAKRKICYVDELYRNTFLSTGDIAKLNLEYAGTRGLIIGDSAESRLITELRKNHNLNIRPCEKGQGSVTAGISDMMDWKFILCGRNKRELEKEFTNYQWHDKRAGVPIDDWNHAIDSIRYALMDYTKRPTTRRVTVAGRRR